MKYFIDTEFIEGTQQKRFLGKIAYGKTKPTIDFISIGIVSESCQEYYAISNQFNLKEAWNRDDNKDTNFPPNYWLRDKVLQPIYYELLSKRSIYEKTYFSSLSDTFSYDCMKYLLKHFGKSNKQIADEIKELCKPFPATGNSSEGVTSWHNPEFYGYYSSYDWVVFCWLFGKMKDLPEGFPMYCRDLKQMMDEKGLGKEWKQKNCPETHFVHNALADAKWNLQLYHEINKFTRL